MTYVGRDEYNWDPHHSISIEFNPSLTSLTGLESVSHISGTLSILNNNSLASLGGIDNMNIYKAYIHYNSSLSTCEVQSICDALAYDSREIIINNNAPGCNNTPEVETACETVGFPNGNTVSEFKVYPNPAKDFLFISSKNGILIKEVNVFNLLGQKILNKTDIKDRIDVSMLKQGTYIVELVSEKMNFWNKIIIN